MNNIADKTKGLPGDKDKFTNTSVRVSNEDLAKLDECADREGRNRTFIINLAIRQYIRAREFQLSRIDKALSEADSSTLPTSDDVVAGLREELKS